MPLRGFAGSGGTAVPCGLLFALAAAIRLASLSADPLWTDERQGMVAAVMRCYQEGDLVQVGNAEEAWTFVAFGGHPTRLSIGEPPAAPARRWVVAGTEVCARGMAEGTCGLSLCAATP